MTFEEKFRAAARAALDEYDDHMGKDDPTDRFIDTLTEAARDWAMDHGSERFFDGTVAEREVHFE